MARPRRVKAESLGELLPRVLRQAGKKAEALQRILAEWERLVGEELAGHSRPVTIRRGVLYLQADDPGTSFGLSLLRVKLLERLPAIAQCPLTDLVIRAGTSK